MKTLLWTVLAFAVFATSCSSGGSTGGDDAGTDSDSDSDTDTDTDSDTDTDTDTDADADTDSDTDSDTDTDSATADEGECAEGWIDCDGLEGNGCETAINDAPPEYAEYGCCHPFDEWDNALLDCDQDGYCECYGICGDPPDEDECWGE